MDSSPINVWLVDDDAAQRWVLERALSEQSIIVRAYEQPHALVNQLAECVPQQLPDVIITDVRMPGMDGHELLARVHASHPSLPVIVITAHADLDAAVAAYQGGAFEYLPKPFDIDEAVALVRRAVAEQQRPEQSQESPPSIAGLIGRAPAMQDLFRTIGRLASSSVSVLIIGESGTGKELIARALFHNSPRRNRPYVAMNMAAIAPELLESEIFGHEKGAFTGADQRRTGRFEQADGGTLFLDEIGDMTLSLQSHLLRVLAENEFYRVGGQQPVAVDVRIIAATNQSLPEAIANGRFREDLYHRLNVIQLNVPPLRDRREDIPLLLEHYIAMATQELNTGPKTLTNSALQSLIEFEWPGNVRQLVNVCRKLVIGSRGTDIRRDDLPEEIRGFAHNPASAAPSNWLTPLGHWAKTQLSDGGQNRLLDAARADLERTLIEAALHQANGHKENAAKLLGIGRNTLARKLRSFEILNGSSSDPEEDWL